MVWLAAPSLWSCCYCWPSLHFAAWNFAAAEFLIHSQSHFLESPEGCPTRLIACIYHFQRSELEWCLSWVESVVSYCVIYTLKPHCSPIKFLPIQLMTQHCMHRCLRYFRYLFSKLCMDWEMGFMQMTHCLNKVSCCLRCISALGICI